jgi:F-type H+-transporting ATPase subunit b
MISTQLTQFGAENASGIGALGVDGKAFVIQLITFVLAFFVLRRYAFTPIGKVLRERRDTIEKGVQLGEQMQREKAELETKIEQLLHEARQEADGIISNARDAGRQAIREAEDKAKEKAAGVLTEAESRIEQETQRARKALEKELVGLVADATEAVLGEKVDAQKDAQLINRALKEQAKA